MNSAGVSHPSSIQTAGFATTDAASDSARVAAARESRDGASGRDLCALRLLPALLSDLPCPRRGDGFAARPHRSHEAGARGRPAGERRPSLHRSVPWMSRLRDLVPIRRALSRSADSVSRKGRGRSTFSGCEMAVSRAASAARIAWHVSNGRSQRAAGTACRRSATGSCPTDAPPPSCVAGAGSSDAAGGQGVGRAPRARRATERLRPAGAGA
jgi:hypothetical protein